PIVNAERGIFLMYAAIAIIAASIYQRIRPAQAHDGRQTARPLTRSRAIVIKLSALFSLDAFGGGFIVQSLLALWLLRRFNLHAQLVGAFFFAAGICGAGSQLVSSAIAARIGRIRTMVYTHIPSNIFLIIGALMPEPKLALGFLLLRSLTSQMDVPARQ